MLFRSIWEYAYDANGRLIREVAPAVRVYQTTLGTGDTVSLSVSDNVRLVTALEYDGLGNVKRRIEAFGTGQARETSYEYDKLGRQIRTRFPAVGVYSNGARQYGIDGAAISRTASGGSDGELGNQVLFTEVTYDALGNAIRNRDVAGQFSHRIYDRLCRVRFEVDALGQVTEHGYDTFGNERAVTRYVNALSSGLPNFPRYSASDVTSRLNANPAADRTIVTTYDRLNRLYGDRKSVV